MDTVGVYLVQGSINETITKKDPVDQILEFIYTAAHAIGQAIVEIIHTIIPALEFPQQLVDPIGMLAIVTVFLVLTEVARKLAWIVVGVGWLLIVIRIVLMYA